MHILISHSKLKMVKLLRYYPSIGILIIVCTIISCSKEPVLYKRSYTTEEKSKLSESLLNGAGTDLYYQGAVGERMIIHEGNSYNEDNAWGQRELGVPYLKRGFAHEAQKYYLRAIENDPEEWLGYKAYSWLYFYRDYEMVLEEIDRFDAFTPNFVDYPQSTSVNYMRGICYLQLDQYEKAIEYFSMHLDKEIEGVGHKYIEAMPYQLLAISYHKNEQYEKADSLFTLGLEHNTTTSDLYYYKAQNLLKMNRVDEAVANLNLAESWYKKGAKNGRPYVEEFYAIYQEDIDELASVLKNDVLN